MKTVFKKLLACMLVLSLVLANAVQLFGGVLSFADDDVIPDKVLFETSFEENDSDGFLSSTLEGGLLQGVINTSSPTGGGKGLTVLYETVDGSEDYLGSECKYNLFDGKTGTKFLSNGSNVYVVFALDKEAVVRSYSIASANDEASRDPKNWTLFGSKDGESWVSLDVREGVSFTARQQTKTFGFENKKAFRWYKFEVTNNCGGSLTQFSNLDLFTETFEDSGEGFVDSSVKYPALESYDGTKDLNGTEVKANLFDGSTSTKWIADGNKDVWVSVKLKDAFAANFYSIAVCNDHHKRDPKSWNLYGSNDGATWDLLDSREDETFADFFQTKTYTFENEKEYTYYKLADMSAVGTDNVGFNITHMSELKFGYKGDATEEKVEIEVDKSTVTGSAVSNGGEGLDKLFDGGFDGKLCTTYTDSLWVSVKLVAPAVVNTYVIGTASDAPARDPKNWNFYGSNDGETWELLDSRENQDLPDRKSLYSYSFENEESYGYYKLEVTANHGTDPWGYDLIQFAELKFDYVAEEDQVAEPVKQTVDTSTVKGSAALDGGQGILQIFDGSVDSKVCVANTTTLWVSAKLTAPAAVNMYKIASANDHDPRDPKDWTLYGSNDGESWVALDVRADEDMPERNTYYTYTFDNTTEYLYYKLDITSNCGTDAVGLEVVQFSEWQLFVAESAKEEKPEPVKQTVDTSTVKGSAALDGGQGILQIFDGSVDSKVCVANTTTLWVSVKLTAPAAVNMYKIASANDHDPRDPKDWTLYGSNDGESWVALDVRADEDMPERNTYYTYTFNNTTEYLYYKLDITSNSGTDAVGLEVVQFSEWQLFVDPSAKVEEEEAKPVKAEVDASTVSGSEDLGGGESKANLFDGKTSTKMVCSGSTFTVIFALTESQVVKGYSITSANDHISRSPRKWNFYGSVDGNDWVKLDSQTGVEFFDYFEEQIFGIANATSYLYYKLEVLENGGNAHTQFSELTVYTQLDESLIPEEIPGMNTEIGFGPIATECNTPGAWSGFRCLAVYGEQTATDKTYAKNVIFKDLSIPVTKNTRLSYVVFPGLFNIHSYDYEYTSCRIVIDLKFTDGTYLSELGAKDQYGSLMTPAGQAEGECLYTAQWNYVESVIGEVAAGKTIEKICVYFDMEDAVDASRFVTFFDDLKIEDKAEVVNEHLSDYINILRGTNNDIAFSRGMCTPGGTMPGGFNFFAPVNNADAPTLPYTYQQTRTGNPLDSISIIHAPNFWIGSYGSMQFMPNTSVNTTDGTDGIISTQISSQNREAGYSHKNEKATAHLYSVLLDEGSAASGVLIEVTPTLHGAYLRFTFPEGSDNVNVIFDSMWGSGTLAFLEDGKTFKAKTSHGSPSMYVYGQFDTAWADASVVSGVKGIAAFEKGTTVVTMKLATSFISYDQAAHNLELEIGANDTFDTILAAAQGEWDALCGKFEIEGASYNELVTFYSSLYRMYAFPSLFSENEGTNEEPKWVYGSPYKSGKKTEGMLYTNNGFWDTYRTAWPGYSLFTADRAGQYVDGIVQHYNETGWIPRWMGPGPVNCMVGTSSDVIFADAYIKGVEFDYEAAFESMVKNAAAYSSNMTAGGRKENNTAPYKGYIANDNPVNGAFVQEAYSSSIEGFINDYGIYMMAEAMGLKDEAEYYLNRCKNYVLFFNEKADFFMGKSTAGVWSSTNFNPAQWNGDMYDFTESVGWVNAFPAVFDGEGLANLYGGEEALAEKLDQLFDDSYEAMKKVVELASVHHEISEFKEVKMGQYEHNNQPSHHVIYTYAFSSTPYKVQEYVREVLRHVYVGSEIGQGYPGDEDNGEMSAWYVFNALGFYPYSVASGEYVIGSPLFDKVTVHLDNGNDIVIIANNNSDENVYIQSAKLNGEGFNKMFLTHEQLTSGCTIEFEMGSEPSEWGSAEDSEPTSLTATGEKPVAGKKDLAVVASKISSAISDVKNLFDDNSLTSATITDGAELIFDATCSKISMITLTSGNASKAPTGFRLEVSNDKESWATVLEEEEISFLCNNFIKPFAIDEELQGNYRYYKLTLLGGTSIAEVEMIGAQDIAGGLDEIPGGQTPPVEPSEPTEPSVPVEPSEPSEPTEDPDIPTGDLTVVFAVVAVVLAVAVAAVVVMIVAKKKCIA